MMNPSGAVDRVLLPLASFGLLPYFSFILLTSVAALARGQRRVRPERRPEQASRFLIVIPAHDEQEGIAATVRSCLAVDYPRTLFDVVVVADNCTDATAARALEAGVCVVERFDDRRSKGHAIEFLIDHIQQTGEFDSLDAIAIVDADSMAGTGLLAAFARRLDEGWEWIQAYNAVGNPGLSWRTRLMAYAFSLINGVNLAGQMALGCGAALRGNGMCLSTSGLRRVPWRAHGLAEDLEYSWAVRLAGGRIAFERAAVVRATMPTADVAAWDTQRRRWETGRQQLRTRMLRPLLDSPRLGLLEKAALAVELTMPTASTLCSAYLLLSVLLAIRAPSLLAEQGPPLIAALAISHAVATASLPIQFASPFLLGLLPWRHASCLLYFPLFVAWKFSTALKTRPQTWVRTAREPLRPA